MKTIYKTLLILTVTTAGCNKTIEVDVPMGKFTNAAVYATDDLAESAMKGVYASMTNVLTSSPFQGLLTASLGLSSDELVRATYSTEQQQLLDNNLFADNAVVRGLWASLYNYIYQANMVYENAEASVAITPKVRGRLMAEARFVRALGFFYLTNLYGNIPLTLTSDYTKNSVLPATGQQKIYEQIIADLKYARDNIGTDHVAPGYRYRPSKWAAAALLAKVYLYQKDWAGAELEASSIISQNSIYKLEALENVFNANSNEAIFNIANAGSNIYTNETGTVQGNASTNGSLRLSDYLLSQFEPNDQRKIKWTKTISGTTAPGKFKTYSNVQAGAKAEYVVVLRLAEIYLIRAEARAMQDNLLNAIKDLDAIRIRAGAVADNQGANATNTFKTIEFSNAAISKADLIAAIYKERMTEYFAELGQRWFDAKRISQGNLSGFFGTRKPGIAQTDEFYPIPEPELLYNPNIKQNDGY